MKIGQPSKTYGRVGYVNGHNPGCPWSKGLLWGLVSLATRIERL